MTQDRVRAAIENAVKGWVTAQALPFAWPNVVFTPPTGIYGRLSILPAPTLSLDLAGDHREYYGLFQVSLYEEMGKGDGAVTKLADSLAAAFPVNRRITQDGLTIQIISPANIAPAVEGDVRDFVPVSITYRADIVLTP
jgi:hypothetical protein